MHELAFTIRKCSVRLPQQQTQRTSHPQVQEAGKEQEKHLIGGRAGAHSHDRSLHLVFGSMAGAQRRRWDRVARSSWDRRGQGIIEILIGLRDWG